MKDKVAPLCNFHFTFFYHSDFETRFLVDPEEVDISCDLWNFLSFVLRLECKSGEDSLWELRELSKGEDSPGSRCKELTPWVGFNRGDVSPLESSVTFLLDSMGDRHIGQMSSWRQQSLQNPLKIIKVVKNQVVDLYLTVLPRIFGLLDSVENLLVSTWKKLHWSSLVKAQSAGIFLEDCEQCCHCPNLWVIGQFWKYCFLIGWLVTIITPLPWHWVSSLPPFS